MEIIEETGVVPHMNQVERHPFYQQKDLADYCVNLGITMTAYSPLGSGRLNELASEIQPFADKYNKTPAQIILRWHFQTDWVLIPKSVNPDRIAENAQIFDFTLEDDDVTAINALDRRKKFLPDPEEATF